MRKFFVFLMCVMLSSSVFADNTAKIGMALQQRPAISSAKAYSPSDSLPFVTNTETEHTLFPQRMFFQAVPLVRIRPARVHTRFSRNLTVEPGNLSFFQWRGTIRSPTSIAF